MSSKYLVARDVEPRVLKPLPVPLRGIACCMCERLQSSWQTEWPTDDDNKVYLCSLCILYATDWGVSVRAEVEFVVMTIQKTREPFEKDASNRLIRSKDADDVLGVVVLSSRVAGVHRVVDSWKAKEPK